MRVFRLLAVLLLFGAEALNGQDMQYSQFFANQLDLNPAFAGSQNYQRVIMNYRNQWPELGQPYVSYAVSYDCHIPDINSGLGVQVEQDRQGRGALVTTTVSGIYSYLVKLRPDAGLRLALSMSVVQNSIDYSSGLVFPDMIDPIFGPVLPHNQADDPSSRSKLSFDFATGALFFMGKYTAGVSVQHLSEPGLAFAAEARLPMKYTLHAGAELPLYRGGLKGGEFTVNPLFMFQKQSEHHQMNYGGFINWNNLTGGMWFRHNFDRAVNALIFMAGYDSRTFRVAYSFDYGISKLSKVGSGSHEISLILLIRGRERKIRYKEIPCPKFFRKNDNFRNGY